MALEGLNEIHMGILQGRYRDERDPDALRWWSEWQRRPDTCRIPGGESFAELKHRVLQSLERIAPRHPGGSVLIVGHRGTNRVLLTALLQWPDGRGRTLRLRAKYLYRIRPGAPPHITTVGLAGSKKGVERDGFLM